MAKIIKFPRKKTKSVRMDFVFSENGWEMMYYFDGKMARFDSSGSDKINNGVFNMLKLFMGEYMGEKEGA